MAMVVTDTKLPILYKCPYCVSGRFTAEDGWDGAVRHIKEKHSGRNRNGGGRRRRQPDVENDLELLAAPAFG